MEGKQCGVLVIGPSGSGKSTFVSQMAKLYAAIGRTHAIINLDPGNETMDYTPAINITDLVTIDEIQNELHLGYFN